MFVACMFLVSLLFFVLFILVGLSVFSICGFHNDMCVGLRAGGRWRFGMASGAVRLAAISISPAGCASATCGIVGGP